MIPNIRANHCPHCKAQAGVIDAQAEVMAALRAENAKLRASNQAAAECVAAMMEECARYRDEIYAALQETER